MLGPHMAGGQPLSLCISAQIVRASSRLASGVTAARKASTAWPVRRGLVFVFTMAHPPPLCRLRRRGGALEVDGHPHSLAWGGVHLEPRAGVLSQRLHDQRA